MSKIFNVRTLLPLIGFLPPVLFFLWWDHQSAQDGAQALAYVSFAQIGQALSDTFGSGELGSAYLASLGRAFAGLLIGGSIGMAVGTVMGLSKPVEWAVSPLYNSLRQVPILGWLPLIGLWFGSGDGAKLIIVALSAFYPTVLFTFEGLKQAEARLLDVSRIYRLNAWQTFWRVRWPAALPSVFTGLFQALAFTWIATIGVELLFSSGFGLGAMMQQAQLQARLDVVLVCVLFVGLTGFLLNALIRQLSQRLLSWRSVRL
ncbi:ABC transporter permease [Asticcacaulis excentricus]|uniref:Alkanesulfonate transport system permease protein n=1 Tax=Asticcacaulis excentricus TaxID=78587 RepID=A0A3G9G8W2_9CAUL|nr:ABC transporter permease [Asticcacaulis excentricus]BBF81554.1 alkanesulfonate transport system permease protein [Asticcacaulis excentricus]